MISRHILRKTATKSVQFMTQIAKDLIMVKEISAKSKKLSALSIDTSHKGV